MNWLFYLTPLDWGGVALVAVGVGVAVWAGPNLVAAIPAAAAATAGAALLAASGIYDRLRTAKAVVEVPESSRWAGLRVAFQSGAMGRQEVVATLRMLHRQLRGGDIGPRTMEEERVLLAESDSRFRAWATSEVELLEEET